MADPPWLVSLEKRTLKIILGRQCVEDIDNQESLSLACDVGIRVCLSAKPDFFFCNACTFFWQSILGRCIQDQRERCHISCPSKRCRSSLPEGTLYLKKWLYLSSVGSSDAEFDVCED